MSKIVKPIALDETLQATNNKLDDLKTQSTSQSTALTNIKTAIDQLKTSEEALSNDLIGVLGSVKSINNKTGAVVLDSGDLKMDKSQPSSKTVKQMVNEMTAAIAQTPLTFTATQIEDDDYLLTVTQGTPA